MFVVGRHNQIAFVVEQHNQVAFVVAFVVASMAVVGNLGLVAVEDLDRLGSYFLGLVLDCTFLKSLSRFYKICIWLIDDLILNRRLF
jgi:hypothetical protein